MVEILASIIGAAALVLVAVITTRASRAARADAAVVKETLGEPNGHKTLAGMMEHVIADVGALMAGREDDRRWQAETTKQIQSIDSTVQKHDVAISTMLNKNQKGVSKDAPKYQSER